jgi:glycosyltransferase involved in cell wall biosynthesis
MTRVVILTTVHPPFDNRIFEKEAKTLLRAGYEVHLVATHPADETVDGIHIHALPKPRGRVGRVLSNTRRAAKMAVELKADIVHIHDFELVPAALRLRRRGMQVVYDVHEDNVTGILQKRYLGPIRRKAFAGIAESLERRAARSCKVVIAERYYAERFPEATPVLNYPDRAAFPGLDERRTFPTGTKQLLYAGSVTLDRGAIEHARLPILDPDVFVTTVGHCPGSLASMMRQEAGPAASRLSIEGVDQFVLPGRIVERLAEPQWLAGLALFPASPHYVNKELTKFFEYMAAGLPVLCSDFPVWRRLIEEADAGICVDSKDPQAVRAAIDVLSSDRASWERMSANGKAAVRDRYNWESEAERLLSLYASLSR